MNPPKIYASLLAANLLRLEEEIKRVTDAGVDGLHIDVMDGHFVPNLAFGPSWIKAIRKITPLFLDVHLMTVDLSPPLIQDFIEAGADGLTVHVEADPHLYRTLQGIKASNIKCGVALNPGTPVDQLDAIMGVVDTILVMTVNPGFGGQTFLEDQLPKIQRIRKKQSGRPVTLQVDGGINAKTGQQAIDAGADTLIAGTGIFTSPSYKMPL